MSIFVGVAEESPWTALSVAARAQHVLAVELLVASGASDPHGRALRECARHGLADLVELLLATKVHHYPPTHYLPPPLPAASTTYCLHYPSFHYPPSHYLPP